MNQEQLNYVKSQLTAGVDEGQIRALLQQNQYSDELINQLLLAAKAEQSGMVDVAENVTVANQAASPVATAQTPTNPAVATQATNPAVANTATAQPAVEATKTKSGLKTWQIILMVIGGIVVAVVAVIVLMASTVLTGLNDARDKGNDAAVMALMSSQRTQAELYFDMNELSYTGFCAQAIEMRSSDYIINCVDDDTGYRFDSRLNDDTYYCVDSTGFAEKVVSVPAGLTCGTN